LRSPQFVFVEGAELVARVRGSREPLERAADGLCRLAREQKPMG
jgi:hypothetical protein